MCLLYVPLALIFQSAIPKACASKVFDNYAVTVMIGDDPYTLGLFDTAGMIVSLTLAPRFS